MVNVVDTIKGESESRLAKNTTERAAISTYSGLATVLTMSALNKVIGTKLRDEVLVAKRSPRSLLCEVNLYRQTLHGEVEMIVERPEVEHYSER